MWPANDIYGEDGGKTYDQTYYIERVRELAGLTSNPPIYPRSRMPIYPAILRLFFDPSRSAADQFVIYKRLNITLSCVALVGIGVLGIRRLDSTLGVIIVIATAFTFFLFKAILVQPEISFYFLYSCLFLFMMDALARPRWRFALFIGCFTGTTHLVKGAALPSIILFTSLTLLQAMISMWKNRIDSSKPFWRRRAPLAVPGCFVAGFLTITGNYMYHSWKYYGSPMYDPNSQYYFWAESPGEMGALQEVNLAFEKPSLNVFNILSPRVEYHLEHHWLPDAAKRNALRNLVEAQGKLGRVILEGEWDILPTAKKWWQTHSFQDAVDRIWGGFFDRERGIFPRNSTHRNGYFWYLEVFACVALGGLIMVGCLKPHILLRDLKSNLLPILFATGSILASLTFFAWWSQISSRNRFFLTQYLPLVLAFGMIIRWCANQLDWKTLRWPVKLRVPLFDGPLLLVMIAITTVPLYIDVKRATELDQPYSRHSPNRTKAEVQLVQ